MAKRIKVAKRRTDAELKAIASGKAARGPMESREAARELARRKRDQKEAATKPDELSAYIAGAAAHGKPFGGFNDFPPNWKAITTHEFWMTFGMWGVRKTEVRQLQYPAEMMERLRAREDRPGVRSIDATLLYTSDEGGLAIVPRREHGNYVQPGYYAFAKCHHMFRPFKSKRRHGSTIRTERCAHCGTVREIDSSD